MIKVNFLSFEQPIGQFYFCVINADALKKICHVEHRSKGDGVQRDESMARIKEIAKYCDDPDATFPTPIILAIDSDKVSIKNNFLEIDDAEYCASIIDGQHRLSGIVKSGKAKLFNMPVVIMLDATEEEKAYVFSIINSKQTKVPPSLIYDLFNVSSYRSPQKTAHEIARALNADENSPFYNRLKMLGKGGGPLAVLSQGAFVKRLLPLITRAPDDYALKIKNDINLPPESLPFNKFFRDGKDEVILKILNNYFNAVSIIFDVEWADPNKYILSKAIGFGALMKSFPKIYDIGVSKKTLTQDFFVDVLTDVKNHFISNNIELTSFHYSSNEQSINKLSKEIIDAIS